LDLLQAIYRTAELPLHTRMKAAIAALPFEHPRLGVTVALDGAEGWATQLQRCIARSRPVLELHAAEPPVAPASNGAQAVSAAALRQPMTLIRRR
jgi:hypothetical protein